MDETTATLETQQANPQDAFLEGWEDEAAAEVSESEQETETADETSEAEETSQEQEETAKAEEEPAAVQTEGETSPAEETQKEAPKEWLVKHNRQTMTLKAEDISNELLQKGLDYDRIRERYDEAKPVMELFSKFAKDAGMSVTDYVKFVRVEAKKAEGLSDAEADRAVELEEREAVISAKEAEAKAEQEARKADEAKVQADLAEFARAFPDIYAQARVNSQVIPEEVWKAVGKDKLSLTAAYARYVTKQAQAASASRAEAEKVAMKNKANAARSTGSMKSAGNDSKLTDPFLDGFGD